MSDDRIARRAAAREWLSGAFERLESGSTFLRTLIVNAAFLIAFLAIVPMVAVEMVRERVTIEPVAAPAQFAELGYTSDVIANRLWDAVQQVNDEARTAKERISILPSSRRVEFAFPDSGLSFESLIYHVRSFFNAYETRIGGEFVCAASPCAREHLKLRIRVLREAMEIVELPPIGATSDDDYFKRAAAQTLRHLDPFVAASWLSLTDPEHALADLRRMVRANHADAKWALNLAGNILSNREQFTEAEQAYKDALAIDQDYVIALSNYSRLKTDTGAPDEAIALARRALAVEPGHATAWLVLGQAQKAKGALGEAATSFRAAAAADPDSVWPHWRLGYLLADMGDAKGARAAYLAAIEVDPDFIEARQGLAALALREGDRPALLAQYREIARLRPGDIGALADVAGALAINKDFEAAIAAYREVLALQPGTAVWLAKLGQLLRDRGDLAGAEAALKEAMAIDPTVGDARFDLAETLRRLGRKPEARAAFEEFLKREPRSIYAALATAYLAQMAE